MQPDALVHLRVPAELKGAWVAASRSQGIRLGDWIIQKINMSDDSSSGAPAEMTPADLRTWQAGMGISGREAARRLGVSPATYQDWVTGTSRTSGRPVRISRVAALACAALAAGLEPWQN